MNSSRFVLTAYAALAVLMVAVELAPPFCLGACGL